MHSGANGSTLCPRTLSARCTSTSWKRSGQVSVSSVATTASSPCRIRGVVGATAKGRGGSPAFLSTTSLVGKKLAERPNASNGAGGLRTRNFARPVSFAPVSFDEHGEMVTSSEPVGSEGIAVPPPLRALIGERRPVHPRSCERGQRREVGPATNESSR